MGVRRRRARRNCRSGLKGELFYRGGMRSLPHMGNRRPNKVSYDRYINIRSSGRGWKGGRGDHFVVRWTGQLHINRGGRYTFCLASDDGSKMYLNGGLVVNNDGLHGMRNRCGARNLRRGSYRVKVAVFEHGGGFGCIWRYRGADTRNRMILVGQNSRSISQCRRKTRRPRRSVRRRRARRNCRSGLKGELFYRGGMRSLPHMGNRRPNKVSYDRYINIRSSGRGWKGGRGDHFVVRWTGKLHINRGGRYTFCLVSDDGSKMYLNGGLVVNNDGLHGMRNRCGARNLRRGSYRVKVAVFEHGGGFGCIWRYRGADTRNRMILVGQNSRSISQCRRQPRRSVRRRRARRSVRRRRARRNCRSGLKGE